MRAAVRFLSSSEAGIVIVNLEDLWLETEPQNRPGTGSEARNWRRKAALSMEGLRDDRRVVGTLEEVHRLRCRRPPSRPPEGPP